jgi:phage baseplate assembly protein gpV
VVIQQSATYDPQITSDGARVGEIEIESGASLEIINDATLNVYGSWYNHGSFSGSNSLVAFRGSGVEIAGSSVTPFGDIEVAGTGVTATADSIDVKGDFTADGSFDHNAGIVSFTGNASQQISGTADSLIFSDMVVDKQADTLHLARHVDVAQYLTLDQGIVASSAGSLMRLMDNAGADQGHDGSYVDGPVEKKGDDPFIFPTGNSGVWAPIEIAAPSQESDVFRARYVFEGHPEAGNDPCNNCGDSIKVVKDVEYWDLSRIQGSSSPDVTLHIKDMSRSGISGIGSLTYAHWNGSQWIDRTLQGSAQLDGSGGCTITGTGFSSYNIHAPAEAAVICPDTGPVYSIPNDFAK